MPGVRKHVRVYARHVPGRAEVHRLGVVGSASWTRENSDMASFDARTGSTVAACGRKTVLKICIGGMTFFENLAYLHPFAGLSARSGRNAVSL